MLWGVYLGSQNDKLKYNGLRDVLVLVISIGTICIHKYFMQHGRFLSLQFVQQLAVFPMLYFFAKVAKARLVKDTIMESRYVGTILTLISGITLEIFMVNNSIDALGPKLGVFPLNVMALLAINIALALIIFYCAKPIVARL